MSNESNHPHTNFRLYFDKAYSSITSLREILKSIKNLKSRGRFEHSDHKLIEEGLIHISQIRQSNAEVLSGIEQAKVKVGHSKEVLEKKNLELQNLTYQNMNISLEIKKHQSIKLENLEKLGYNINEVPSTTHQLKDVLYKELNERKSLQTQLSDLKRKFSENSYLIKEKQSILNKIPLNFSKISKTLFPAELVQGLNETSELSDHQSNQKALKKLLPKPLFVLYSYMEEYKISQQINQETPLQLKIEIVGDYGEALQFIQSDVFTKYEISQNSVLTQSLLAQDPLIGTSSRQIANSNFSKSQKVEVIDLKEEGEEDDADCLTPIAEINNCSIKKEILQRIQSSISNGAGISAHPLSVYFSFNSSENKVMIHFYYIPALGCVTLRVESALDINEHSIFENLGQYDNSCTSEIQRLVQKISITDSKGTRFKSHYFEVVDLVFNSTNIIRQIFKSCAVRQDLNSIKYSLNESLISASFSNKTGFPNEQPQLKVNTLLQAITQRIKNISYVASQICSIQQNKCISQEVLTKMPYACTSRNFNKSIDLSIISQIDFYSEIRTKDSQGFRIESALVGPAIFYKKISHYQYSSSAAIYFKLQIKKIGYSLSAVFEVGNNYPQPYSIWTLVKIISASKISQDLSDIRFIEQIMYHEQLRIEAQINSEYSSEGNPTSVLFSQIILLHDLFDKAYERLKEINSAACSYILEI